MPPPPQLNPFDPTVAPVQWNCHWETQTKDESLTRDCVKLFFCQFGRKPDDVIDITRYTVRSLMHVQQSLFMSYRGETFDRMWKATSSADRKRHMLEGLVRSYIKHPTEDVDRFYCGDLVLDALDEKHGDAFIRLLKAYVTPNGLLTLSPETVRSTPHPTWTREMEMERKRDKDSAMSVVWQFIQMRRDLHLCRFLEGTLDSFANIPRPSVSPQNQQVRSKGQLKMPKEAKQMFKDQDRYTGRDTIKEMKDLWNSLPVADTPRECEYCGKKEDAITRLKQCTKCMSEVNRKVTYCSLECQRGDWKEHKAICGKVLTVESATSISVPSISPAVTYGYRFGDPENGRTRSAALEKQVALLNVPANKAVDYFLFTPSGKKYPIKVFPDSAVIHKTLFEDTRYAAIIKHDELMTFNLVQHLFCRGVALSRATDLTEAHVLKQLQAEYDWYPVIDEVELYRMFEKLNGGKTNIEMEADDEKADREKHFEEDSAWWKKELATWEKECERNGTLDVLKRAVVLAQNGDMSGKKDVERIMAELLGEDDDMFVKEQMLRQIGFR